MYKRYVIKSKLGIPIKSGKLHCTAAWLCVTQDLYLLCFRAVTTRCCSCPSGLHSRQWTCLVLRCTGAISLAQFTPSVSASAGPVRVRIR